MADEVRLVPIRFVPDDTGGRWEPVNPATGASAWANAWDAGITQTEGKQLLECATSYDTRLPRDSHYQPVEDKLRGFVGEKP